MTNGHCPRCTRTEVFHQSGDRHQSEKITLTQGVVSKAAVPDRYVCVACGYVELYLVNANDLAVIRETWNRVPDL